MNWVTIVEDDINTYPKEGINVIISDGEKYDVAYYLMSSTYVWMKIDVIMDDVYEFTDFKVTKWTYTEIL
jgi:hypothetical protein